MIKQLYPKTLHTDWSKKNAATAGLPSLGYAFIYYGKLLTNDNAALWGNLLSIWRNLCNTIHCPALRVTKKNLTGA